MTLYAMRRSDWPIGTATLFEAVDDDDAMQVADNATSLFDPLPDGIGAQLTDNEGVWIATYTATQIKQPNIPAYSR